MTLAHPRGDDYKERTMGKRSAITERQLDALADDGRLSNLAMRLAIDAGNDWPSLSGEAQDAWCELAIKKLRSGALKPPR
jgi:hypothetical protein